MRLRLTPANPHLREFVHDAHAHGTLPASFAFVLRQTYISAKASHNVFVVDATVTTRGVFTLQSLVTVTRPPCRYNTRIRHPSRCVLVIGVAGGSCHGLCSVHGASISLTITNQASVSSSYQQSPIVSSRTRTPIDCTQK